MLSYFFGNGKKEENQDPILALQEQLDGHGNFDIKSDMCMDLKDFLVFRSIILRQTLRKFQPIKE